MTFDNCKAGEVLSGGDWERMLAEFEAIGAEEDSPEAVGAAPVARHIDRVPPFQVDGVHPQVLEAREQVRQFTRAVLRKSCAPYSLALLGGSGCGKTHLARLARAALLDAGVDCQLWAWAAVLDAYREDKGDLLRQLDETRVLVLDDIGAEFLGTEKATEFRLQSCAACWTPAPGGGRCSPVTCCFTRWPSWTSGALPACCATAGGLSRLMRPRTGRLSIT